MGDESLVAPIKDTKSASEVLVEESEYEGAQ
jgi:hypothetical protein